MKQIAIVVGGYSGESVISMQSGQTVYDNLDRKKIRPHLVKISREGWSVEHDGTAYPIDRNDFSANIDGKKLAFDGAFVAIHGAPGEDGKLQGYFDMLDLPYNCCDVLTASLTFNKGVTNRYLKTFGIHSAERVILYAGDTPDLDAIIDRVGIPCFVKPNASGSSLGISKVNKAADLGAAIEFAFKEDSEVIIETFIEGPEITCGCHDTPTGAESIAVTEIVAENEFFDFEAKYNDSRTQEITPARVSQKDYDACMQLTEVIYAALRCRGMIRVDYILRGEDLYVIEVNTIPGLSPASLIPKMVEYRNWSLSDFFTNSVEQMFR